MPANIFNKQSRTAVRGDPPAWGLVEGLTIPHRKKETVTNSLDKVYADDVNMLGGNLQNVRENAEIFIKSSKDINLEVNSEKTKYMITSRHQNLIQNQSIVIGNLSLENVEKFRYLRVR